MVRRISDAVPSDLHLVLDDEHIQFYDDVNNGIELDTRVISRSTIYQKKKYKS